MDLHELEPEKKRADVLLEEPEEAPAAETALPRERRPRKRKKSAGRWLAAALAAAAVVVLLLLVLPDRGLTVSKIEKDPLGTLCTAVERVAPLPRPLSLGFLGTVELDDIALGGLDLGPQSLNCSGVVDMEAGDEGFRLAVRDCTLGNEDEAVTFSLYLSPREAALAAPALFGGDEGWRGVRLDAALADQVPGMDPAGLQEVLDDMKEALCAVTDLGLTEAERGALRAYLAGCQPAVEETDVGFLVTFAQSDTALSRDLALAFGLEADAFPAPSALDFELTRDGVLRGVTGAGGALAFSLELGDDPANDLTPRLEANWPGGALVLAFTLDQGGAVTAPDYAPLFN